MVATAFPIIAAPAATVYVSSVNGSDAPTPGRGSFDLPYATLNAGVSALSPGGVLDVGDCVYAAPVTVPIPAGCRIRGAKAPSVDSLTAPTRLQNGAVIPAPLSIFNDNISLEKVGIDGGSAVCTALYGGNAVDGLAISNVPDSFTIAGGPTGGTFTLTVANLGGTTATTTAIAYGAAASTVASALMTALATLGLSGVTVTGTAGNWVVTPALPVLWGISAVGTGSLTGGTLTNTIGHPTGTALLNAPAVNEVVCLAQSPTSGTHAFRFENVVRGKVNNVETFFGSYGLACKAIDSNVDNVIASGAGVVGIYFKSDFYALCHDCNGTNLIARAIGSSGATAWGVAVDAFDAAISNIQLSNVDSEAGIQYGMEFNAASGLTNVSVNGGSLATGILWQNLAQTGTALTAVSAAGVPQRPVVYVGASGAPAFQGGWANYGSGYSGARFWKDADGMVHLAGLVTGSSGAAIFALPVGYRPASPSITVPGAIYGGSPAQVFNGVNVFSNGLVGPYNGTVGTYWLDGISFSTD